MYVLIFHKADQVPNGLWPDQFLIPVQLGQMSLLSWHYSHAVPSQASSVGYHPQLNGICSVLSPHHLPLCLKIKENIEDEMELISCFLSPFNLKKNSLEE